MASIKIEKAKDYLRIDYEALESSYIEADEIREYYHNRQYTAKELAEFKALSLKPENFNIIKLHERVLRGYFSSITSSVRAKAGNNSSPVLAQAFDDTLNKVLVKNNFDLLSDTMKLSTLLYGFTPVYYNVKDSGRKNSLGETINDIKFEILPARSVIPDHMARKSDFSDSRRVSHWKWISRTDFKELFGTKKVRDCERFSNYSTELANEYLDSKVFGAEFNGQYVDEDKFLVVNTVVKTKDGWESYHWCGDILLKEEKLDFNPYRCFKIYEDTIDNEMYGIFREILPIQDAVNTHVMNIKRFDSDERLFVDVNKLEMTQDIQDFATAKQEFSRMYNSANEIIFMNGLTNAFHAEKYSKEIAEEFQKLEAALQRARDLLGITPSFLGDAAASDSGRKVKFQQQASANSFRYIDTVLKSMLETLGYDLSFLIKKYYTAHDLIRLTNKFGQDHWTEINAPFMMPIQTDKGLMHRMLTREVIDKDGRVLRDKDDKIRVKLIREPEQDLSSADIEIEVTSYNHLEKDEMERVVTETIVQGMPGQMLANANPASYMKMLAISLRSMKSEHSEEFAQLFEQTAEQLGFVNTEDPRAYQQNANLGGNSDPKNGGAQLANALGMQNGG